MPRRLLPLLSLACLSVLVPACGSVPKATQTRESGQSGLMDESFAGKNACNPDNAERPFIIEWDATDMSSFESYAANDVVLVRYEGCNLKILDECRNDSIRGSQGAYKPVEWTTGSLEKLNISSQGELYAKLPLGAASLGGRVAGGEKFSMEYYVAGTRSATRDAVYRADLGQNPGCDGATHFVYGYNLGAFALGSVKDFSAEAGGSVYGFGVGGKTSSNSSAEKKGGDLSVCKSDSATEIAGCKAPIRLTLRKVRDGVDPGKAAMSAPDTTESLNAAGQVNQKIEASAAASAHYDAAFEKQKVRDGKGCLAELDQYDKLEPTKQSTDPKSPAAKRRGLCVMLSGRCEAGKEHIRKTAEAQGALNKMTPGELDDKVSAYAQVFCEGKLPPRDDFLRSYNYLGGNVEDPTRPTAKTCADHHATAKKLAPTLKPRDPDDAIVHAVDPRMWGMKAAECMGRAGDCKQAYKLYVEYAFDKEGKANVDKMQPQFREPYLLDGFERSIGECKGKPH